jgi:hypothetical protein
VGENLYSLFKKKSINIYFRQFCRIVTVALAAFHRTIPTATAASATVAFDGTHHPPHHKHCGNHKHQYNYDILHFTSFFNISQTN